ncbi:SPASM domain-containing protein [Bacteroides sp.]
MRTKEYCTDLLISYDPNYLILDTTANNEYIFYNSVRHFGCRINKLELLLLDLLYKYENVDYITSQFPIEKQDIVKNTLQRVADKQVLSVEPLEKKEESTSSINYPQTYYLHLTYKCNLACTYCYNQEIRSNKAELSLSDWKKIIDKIAPYASKIILTGGECFLYHDFSSLVKYIKETIKEINLSCISNCMHDFSSSEISVVLDCIDDITFSCDSISREGERKGFKPELFRKNIEYLRKNKPNIRIGVSTTNTADNASDIHETKQFCMSVNCEMMNVVLVPNRLDNIELMPPISGYLYDNAAMESPSQDSYAQLPMKRTGCGAAKSTCSIDPRGNVYPCQSLHYNDFLMGNILHQDIEELRYLNKKEKCLPTVDEIPTCAKCKVKYICGGCCPAAAYELDKKTIGRSKLTCPYNHHLAILTLEKIKNNPLKE